MCAASVALLTFCSTCGKETCGIQINRSVQALQDNEVSAQLSICFLFATSKGKAEPNCW